MTEPRPTTRTTECELHVHEVRSGRLRISLFECRDDSKERHLWPVPGQVDHEVEITVAQVDLARRARQQPSLLAKASNPDAVAFAALVQWTWETVIPDAARRYLVQDRGPGGLLRVALVLHGEASLLPWEALPSADSEFGERVRGGMLELVRRSAAGTGIGKTTRVPLRRPPVHRKAVVLIGHTLQEFGVHEPIEEVAATVAALQAAEFEVVTICGHPRIDAKSRLLAATDGSIRIDEVLAPPPNANAAEREALLQAQVSRLLVEHRPAVVHVFGHAGQTGSDGGTEALLLDAGAYSFTLPIGAFAAALRQAAARVVVLSACHTREVVAHQLLALAAVEQVVTMSALVTPAQARTWASGFYGGLGTKDEPRRSIHAAVASGRRSLQQAAPHVTWLPQHWARPEAALAFAGADEELVERYCDAVARGIDAFEGRFVFSRWKIDGSLRDVYVELGVRDAEGRVELDERDDPAAFRQQPTFAHIVDLHTRRILLGGDPGAGKSTTLRMFAHDLARDTLRATVPVFVPLARWARSGDTPPALLDFAVHEYLSENSDKTTRDEFHRVLCELGQEGRLCFLLDGLDELSGSARTRLEKAMAGLFPRCKVVVSSRRYQHSGSLKGFFDADLAHLSPERAVDLLGKLLGRHNQTKAEVEDHKREWLGRFTNGPAVWQQLGRVPLFVALIAELLTAKKEPSASRAAFFDEVFEHLLLNQHRGHDAVEPRRVEAGASPMIVPDPNLQGAKQQADTKRRVQAVLDVLGHLAMTMTKALTIEASHAELCRWIGSATGPVPEALELLNLTAEGFFDAVALKTGMLGPEDQRKPHPGTPAMTRGREGAQPNGEAQWRFWHRSFQEALTAWEMERLLLAGTTVDALLASASMSPTAELVEEQAQALREAFDKDDEAVWDPQNELLAIGSAEDRSETWKHYDATGWKRGADGLDGCVAKRLPPYRAQQAQQEFWVEPTALLASRLAESRAGNWPSRARSQLVVGADAFLSSLLDRDPVLGRRAVACLDRVPSRLLWDALAATSFRDEQVRAAATPDDLWIGMTNRLREREPLYSAAPSRMPAAELARLLADRAGTVDDAGELFLVALTACRLPSTVRAAAQAAVAARLEMHPPDSEAWRGHFVALPGGTYRRGSEQGAVRERPVHDIRLAPFSLGRTPVPVSLWRQFWPGHRMAYAGRVATLEEWGDQKVEDGAWFGDLPVTCVSWYAARMFCRWLQHHRQRLHVVLGDLWPELPTEAQAEYAIRGGTTGEWWFGKETAAMGSAWFERNSDVRPHAVGTKSGNALGLHDVVGNVWWWCLDAFNPRAYAAHAGKEAVDPRVSGSSASSRVVRGGSFAFPVHFLRSAFRSRDLPAFAFGDLGVRVALVAAPSELGSDFDLRSLGM